MKRKTQTNLYERTFGIHTVTVTRKTAAVLQTRTQYQFLLKKGNVTNNGVTEKEQTIQDIIWGVGSETLYQKNRAEYETGPDSIK